MNIRILSAAIVALLALPACKKAGGDTPAATDGATAMTEQPAAGSPSALPNSMLPKADMAKPLSEYQELDSGNQLMFLYVAVSKLPPDFAKLAEAYSKEYRSTSDSFRRNDLLKAIQPQLEQQIAAADSNRYLWVEIDQPSVRAYDFERKGFPIEDFDRGSYRYFYDNNDYSYDWANGAQVAFAPVPDEAVARQIETLRSSYNPPKLKVFFYIQSADLNSQRVHAYVTRVQLLGKGGSVLAEYGPDGSVAPQKAKEAECADAAACIAADVMRG